MRRYKRDICANGSGNNCIKVKNKNYKFLKKKFFFVKVNCSKKFNFFHTKKEGNRIKLVVRLNIIL